MRIKKAVYATFIDFSMHSWGAYVNNYRSAILGFCNYFIGKPILYSFFGAHPEVTVNIFFNFTKLLASVFSQNFV